MISTLAVFVLLHDARQLGMLQPLELAAYDRLLWLRPAKEQPTPPIVLIRIQESDLQRFGGPYPYISDVLLAQALEKLLLYNPRAIGIDLFRDFPGTGREDLAAVVAGNSRIVMVDKRVGESVPFPDFLEGEEQVGFADLILDYDRVIRRGLLILWDPENSHQPSLSFSLQLALRYLQPEGITLTADPDDRDLVRLGSTTLPRFRSHDGGYQGEDEGGYQYLMDYARVDYARGITPFPALSLADVLEGEVDPGAIEGRIVLIGTTSPIACDQHEIPFSSQGGGGPIYGVEWHAHAVDQLLRIALSGESPIKTLNERQEMLGILLLGFIGGMLGIAVQSSVLLVVAAFGSVALPMAAAYLLFLEGWWLPVAVFTLAGGGAFTLAMASTTVREHRERKQVMALFGCYVSRKVADTLWQQREEFMEKGRLRPQELTATVLISDLMGYTSALEKIDPACAMEWINHYLGTMAQIVEDHGGIVEDYAGDGLKASFGAPVPRTDPEVISHDAQQAVNCALAMGEQLARASAALTARGLPLERFRVGICTGPVIAGSVGSSHRMTYTTLGDTVNIAARLESFGKAEFKDPSQNSFRILVSESTWQRLGPRYHTERLGVYNLRGKDHPLTIYRVLGFLESNKPPASEENRP